MGGTGETLQRGKRRARAISRQMFRIRQFGRYSEACRTRGDAGGTSTIALRFDFGTDASPTASGYTRVTNATGYSSSLGYGWLSAPRGPDVRGTDPLARDYQLGQRFHRRHLRGGPGRRHHRVTVAVGGSAKGHDQQAVYLEKALVESVTTAGGQYVTRTYTVSPTDSSPSAWRTSAAPTPTGPQRTRDRTGRDAVRGGRLAAAGS